MTKPTTEQIAQYVIEYGLVQNPTVSFFAEGQGNYNYLLEEDGRKLVVRTKKSTEKSFADSLQKEYLVLRFIAAAGIDNFPKAIHYDAKRNILVESFLAGKTTRLTALTDLQLREYLHILHNVFSLDSNQMKRFCDQENFSDLPAADPVASLDIYGTRRLESAKQGSWPLDAKLVDWLEQNLEQNYKLCQDFVDTRPVGISLGDLQSAVIVDEDGAIQLYDLEHAQYAHSVGLSYLKIHGGFTKERFSTLVSIYAQIADVTEEACLSDIVLEERMTWINDVIWAAMRWAETGEEKYNELMWQRKALAEEFLQTVES